MRKHGDIWVPETYAETAPKPRTGEVATVRSDPDWDQEWMGEARTNPDEILRKRATESGGDAIKLYDEMDRKDPQLSSFVQTRINGVLSKDRRIVPGEDSDAARAIAEGAQAMFDRIPDFEQDLREMMRAISHGFSVAEVMWQRNGNALDIADLVSRPQRRFDFDMDWRLRMLTKDNQVDGEPVEKRYPRKFLVHTHNRAGMNRYGRGEYQFAYWPYFFKKNCLKFWAIFIEKRALPIIVGRYDRENSGKDQRSDIKKAIREVVHDTGIIIPDDIELEFVEVTSSVPVRTMKDFVELMADWQAQRILGQTLTTGKGAAGLGQGGVAAQHGAVRQEYIEADSKELLPVLDQAVRWYVDVNHGPQEAYPHWQIDYEPAKDLKTAVEVDKVLIVDMGLPVVAEDIYEKYGWRKPEDEDELLTPAAPKPKAEPFGELSPRQQLALGRIDRDTQQITGDGVADGKTFFDQWRQALIEDLKKKAPTS